MRIEVLVGNEDPQVYPLDRPKILIGSSDNCDIVLSTQGVSRKHVAVLVEDDRYYVIDQGSTNGSFINEERLVPGRRAEFTSFFPVRLGDNVLLTLLSDEETEGFSFAEFNAPKNESISPGMSMPAATQDHSSDATRTISLKDLRSASTETLVKKRREIVAKRKKAAPPKKVKKADPDKSRMFFVKFMVLMMIGGAVYYNLYMKEDELVDIPVAKVGEVVPVETVKAEPEVPKKSLLVDESLLEPHEAFVRLLHDMRCVTDNEKYLCNTIAGAGDNPWGVTQVGAALNVMIDANPYFSEARRFLPPPPQNANPRLFEIYEGEVAQVAAALFLHRAVPETLDYALLQDQRINFALMAYGENGPYVKIVIAVLPESLQKVKKVLNDKIFQSMRIQRLKSLAYLDGLYRVY